jgi:hypothetical protein
MYKIITFFLFFNLSLSKVLGQESEHSRVSCENYQGLTASFSPETYAYCAPIQPICHLKEKMAQMPRDGETVKKELDNKLEEQLNFELLKCEAAIRLNHEGLLLPR